jgi:hypothetical protein
VAGIQKVERLFRCLEAGIGSIEMWYTSLWGFWAGRGDAGGDVAPWMNAGCGVIWFEARMDQTWEGREGI